MTTVFNQYSPDSGIGAEIGAQLMEADAFDYLDAPVLRVTGVDIPMPFTQTLEVVIVFVVVVVFMVGVVVLKEWEVLLF